MSLQAGLTHERSFTVTEDLTTDVKGSVANRVLSTPMLVKSMERTAMAAIWDDLPEGSTCVGYAICIKHVSSAPLGGHCQASAVLTEIVDGRKLHFDVRVEYDGRVVGVGTHERRIIKSGSFDKRNKGGGDDAS